MDPIDASAVPDLPIEVEDLLTWLSAERGRAANTIAAYRRDLRTYLAWLTTQGRTLAEVTEADLVEYVSELRSRDLAAASVARSLVPVRSLHRFLVEEGRADSDPGADLELPRVPRGVPKALSEPEILRLLASPEGDEPLARRDRAMLEVLYGTGLRGVRAGGALDGRPRPRRRAAASVRQGRQGAHRPRWQPRAALSRRLARTRRSSGGRPGAVGSTR